MPTAPAELPPTPGPARRVQRQRHELRRRDLRVVAVSPLGQRFVSVTFGGDDLQDFLSSSFDDHLKLMLDGGIGDAVRRDYTPRRFDAARRELTIEFALHGHGAASNWARQAAVGQSVAVAGPRGSMIIPVDYDWHLLAGDATALPAVRRRLEELPDDARVLVLLQADPADAGGLPARPGISLQWAPSSEAWLSMLDALPWPTGEGFAWCAGEASTMAQARHILLERKRHPREHLRVAAYWKRGAAGHHENLESAGL